MGQRLFPDVNYITWRMPQFGFSGYGNDRNPALVGSHRSVGL